MTRDFPLIVNYHIKRKLCSSHTDSVMYYIIALPIEHGERFYTLVHLLYFYICVHIVEKQ